MVSDSQTVSRVISAGSMRPELNIISQNVFKMFAKFQICAIHLEIQWIPRFGIERADFISRFVDIDDWKMTTDCFNVMDKLWGSLTVDSFANFYNRKIGKYFSRCLDFFVQKFKVKIVMFFPEYT